MKYWHSINFTPPDKLVEVIDKNNNIGYAYPTYYPFKVGENKTGRKWGNEITPCKPYWDGGWMIQNKRLEKVINSEIVGWRIIINWIKLNDELPQYYKSVAIKLKDGTVTIASMVSDGDNYSFIEGVTERVIDSNEVDEWMPPLKRWKRDNIYNIYNIYKPIE
jgi:hypothetical protein